jgi:hypothetical protein
MKINKYNGKKKQYLNAWNVHLTHSFCRFFLPTHIFFCDPLLTRKKNCRERKKQIFEFLFWCDCVCIFAPADICYFLLLLLVFSHFTAFPHYSPKWVINANECQMPHDECNMQYVLYVFFFHFT